MNGYRTVQTNAVRESVIQKSRFIGQCFPVESEKEAEAHLARLRKQYWDATHNCYAFRIGARGELCRSSDDGEPSGTAGLPILQTLTGRAVTNVLCVVTRYFGGILLGTGGLVRAYGASAAESVDAAGILQMAFCTELTMEVPYPLWTGIERLLLQTGAEFDAQYQETVRTSVWMPEDDAEKLIKTVFEKSAGKILPLRGQTAFRPLRTEPQRS